jgi:hypothetical protein
MKETRTISYSKGSFKMKKTNGINIIMIILPWLTFPFLPRKTVSRFIPTTIFMSLFLIAEGRFAEKKKWWWFFTSVKPNVLAEMPLIIGPFFIGSLWILKYTFGKFKLYLLINLVVDSFFTYFLTNWLRQMGYGSLVRLSKFKLSSVFFMKSVLLYGFQFIYEKCFGKSDKPENI